MGNGVGWEQAVWHSTIRLSYSWAHQVCPRQPIHFDCKNFLQLWCVLYRNARPYRPAVCNQPYLHTQADEALEKKSLEQKYSTIPGITEMLDILVKLGKVYQRRVCFNGEYTDHIVTSDKQQKKKRQCAFPGCDRSGHVNPARKHHLSEKNCPLAAKKPRVPHCNVVLFWYLYLEVICV